MANVPENWVYNTKAVPAEKIEDVLAALPINVERLGSYHILVKPKKGYERAVRYICGTFFKRLHGTKALEILSKYRAATTS